jgi:GT2 family glycosyltransferase
MDAREAVSPPTDSPALSVVVLAWDNLELTKACADSVRRNTDVAYELIIVDNGSKPDAAAFAEAAADHAVMNVENLGFARGMNRGLEAARGELVAFCNNDIVVPPQWAARLVETMRSHPKAGIVVPAITAATNPITVRSEAGTAIEVLEPFSAPPAGVVYLMRVDAVNALGRWEEEYEIASGEDVDLCFKVWVNDLDIVFDERVLVNHVGHATASKLDDSQQLWALNRRRFLEKWMGPIDPPRLATCPPERFTRNRATARAVAGWMEKYFTIRDRQRARASFPAASTSPWLRPLRAAYRRTRRRFALRRPG